MSRERIEQAFKFKPVDIIPLEYFQTPVRGLFDHGEKLIDLFNKHKGDFGDFVDLSIPTISKDEFDEKGNYHKIETDIWGTTWEYRIFGMAGHPLIHPINSIDDVSSYKFPKNQLPTEEEFTTKKNNIFLQKQTLFYKEGWVSLFEKLIALRKFEDVLAEIAEDTDEINYLADNIVNFYLKEIELSLKYDVDAIQFGDDYGTQQNLIMSPQMWRRFIKPRLKKLIEPVKKAGKKVMFHSCGNVYSILDDLKEIGVDSIWPQLTLYDNQLLASKCKELNLALAIHLDRANLMTFGTKEQITQAVDLAVKNFDMKNGGSWFYVEIDNGFPYENIETLIESISKYRI